MTNDLVEQQLRTALHDAASAQDGAYLDLDPSLVLAHGRRAVRRRRAAAGIGLAAATVVAGLVGWSALGGGGERASLPAGTPSVTRPVTVTAVLDEFSALSDPATGQELSIPGPSRLAVTVDPAGTPDLVYSAVGPADSLSVLGGSSLAGVGPLASTWGTAGEGSHVVVGVLPDAAEEFSLVTPIHDDGRGVSTSVEKELPGTGRTAFGTRFSEASEAAAVEHLLWWGRDRSVHDETGAVVPSTTLDDPAGTTVFVARSLDRLGTFSRGGATMMTLAADRNTSGRPFLSSGRGEDGAVAGLFAAVVPDGTTAGSIVLADGTTLTRPLAVAAIPDSDVSLVWAAYSSPQEQTGSPWTSVSWTEPGGSVVTERAGR